MPRFPDVTLTNPNKGRVPSYLVEAIEKKKKQKQQRKLEEEKKKQALIAEAVAKANKKTLKESIQEAQEEINTYAQKKVKSSGLKEKKEIEQDESVSEMLVTEEVADIDPDVITSKAQLRAMFKDELIQLAKSLSIKDDGSKSVLIRRISRKLKLSKEQEKK